MPKGKKIKEEEKRIRQGRQKIGSALALADIDNIKKGIEYERRIGRIRLLIALILVASFIVFLVIAAFGISEEGLPGFLSAIYSMNLYDLGIALLIIFIGYVMRYPKWHLYMKRLGVKISAKTNFSIYMSMYSMDITPGRWGRAVVSYTINKLAGIKFAVTFPAVVADIFTDFLGFVVILLATTFFLGKFVLLSLAITILLLIPFVFIYVRKPFEYVKRKLGKIKRLRSVFESGDIYFENNKLLTPGVYAYSMVYTIPAMFLNGLALYYVILAFNVPLTPAAIPTVLFIFTSSLILGMVTGLPATLGVTDAALVGYLLLFFPSLITAGVASLITIFFRLASVWFVQGFGSVALLDTMRYWRGPNSQLTRRQ